MSKIIGNHPRVHFMGLNQENIDNVLFKPMNIIILFVVPSLQQLASFLGPLQQFKIFFLFGILIYYGVLSLLMVLFLTMF